MGSGPPRPRVSIATNARSWSADALTDIALPMTVLTRVWAHRAGMPRTRRRGVAQEASWRLLVAMHGTTRWAAIPPPPSLRAPTPATIVASDAGV